MKREELEVVTLDEIAQDLVEDQVQPDEYYVKEDADKVMDTMEQRIKELEAVIFRLQSGWLFHHRQQPRIPRLLKRRSKYENF